MTATSIGTLKFGSKEEALHLLIEHSRTPRNRVLTLNHPAARILKGESHNPICGDRALVLLSLLETKISDCAFQVQGCAMCTASASLMSEGIKTKPPAEILTMIQTMTESLLAPPTQEWPAALIGFWPLAHLRVNRARIPCALIPWFAVKTALQIAEHSLLL